MNKEYKKYRNEVLKCIETKEIRDRMEYLLNWYSRKATQCKRRYYIFAAIGIIGPALVTVISNCTYLSDFCLVPVISTCSSIGTAILALTRWQEGWIRYRRTVEHIKSYISIYIVSLQGATDVEKIVIDKEFIKKIDNLVLDENSEWTNIRSKDINGNSNSNSSQHNNP